MITLIKNQITFTPLEIKDFLTGQGLEQHQAHICVISLKICGNQVIAGFFSNNYLEYQRDFFSALSNYPRQPQLKR